MNIQNIDRELHAQAMAKGHFIIAGLIANKLITTGAKLGADQRANPRWHEAKRKEFKRIKDAHLFRIELHDWKDRLMFKFYGVESVRNHPFENYRIGVQSATGYPVFESERGVWEIDEEELERIRFDCIEA
ncbi:MAG: hypothetical protein PHQ03_07345 [Methylococcales bacterium]|nr:hypothetical protein [Methylococcales bacterium]